MPVSTDAPPTAPTAPTVRLLPPEEWPRLAGFEPFASSGLPSPDHWRILIAEDPVTGAIVAFNCLFQCVHMEPLWIHPAYRSQPRAFYQLLTDLWANTRQVLDEAGVTFLFAMVDDQTGTRGRSFVEHLGFQRATGQLYLVPVGELRLPTGGA